MALFASTTPYTLNLPLQSPFPIIEEAKAAEIPITATSSLSIKGKISYYAKEYKVSSTTMDKIIQCESGYDPTIQSHYTYSYDRDGHKAGDREQSFGLVQIHLPAHPTVSKEQALDPDFALVFLATELQKGNGRIWACFPSGES